ncbi:MAG: TolC family protein [Balneolaceae bacterium]
MNQISKKFRTTLARFMSVKFRLRKQWLLLFLLIPASVSFVNAQDIEVNLPDTHSLSLEQAIHLSVANNPEIKRALLLVEDADQQVRLAWSEVLPEVTTSATYTRNVEIPVNFVPARAFDPNAPEDELVPLQFGTDNNWQGGVTVSQNIFRGEAIVGISSSALYKSAQQENMRATIQQIITQSRKAYHAALVARERHRLQVTTVERLEENLRENRLRLQAGLIDEYDVLRLEVQLANQEPQLVEAQLEIEESFRNLKEIMGLPLELDMEIEGNLSEYEVNQTENQQNENDGIRRIDQATPLPVAEDNHALNIMRENRGDLRALQVQEDLKDREIMALKSRFLPTITADYNLQWTSAQAGSPRPFENEVRYQTLVFNVSFPLFTGFQRMANFDIAQIEKKDIQVQQWATEKMALNEHESALNRIYNLKETVSARRHAVEQAQRGYEIATRRLSNGIGSQLDVSEAELQVREAELNYALLVFEYLDAKADFDLSIGLVPLIDSTDYEF